MVRESEVEGIDDHRIWEDVSVCVIGSGIYVILLRKGISGSYLCSQGNLPDDVKILEKEGPASLAMREFARVLEVGQVFMVGEDRDRMWGALQVLFPFAQSKDDSEKLSIIDIIVSFCCREGFGEVCTGVKVTRGVRLHQDCSSREERSICHEREGV